MKLSLFRILAGLLATSLLSGCGGGSGFELNSSLQNASSEPFFEGTRTIRLEPYKLPELINKRTQEETLDDGLVSTTDSIRLSESNKKLVLDGFDFDVNLDRKKMIFRGELKLNGKKFEKIEMEGSFDPSESPWVSDDLFPVDNKVRSERRMQATAVCIDTNVCDRVAVRFYLKFEGELLELHFEKDTVVVEQATSGHEDEEPLVPHNGSTETKKSQTVEKPKTPPSSSKQSANEDPMKDSLVGRANPAAPSEDDDEIEYEENEEEPEQDEVQAKAGPFEDNPEKAYEYNGPIATPTPKVTKDSVKGIEKVKAATFSKSSKVQSIDKHNRGRLQNATPLPSKGKGFVRRDGPQKAYGADVLIQMIESASARAEVAFPGRPPISIGNLSAKTGRKLSVHKSHQNGLDADIGFPRVQGTSTRFWVPLSSNGGLVSDFDKQRFWKFAKEHANSSNKVMVIFVDRTIKKNMCAYARSMGENPNARGSDAYRALRSMYHVSGHRNHIHVRMYCPGTVGCANTMVSLPNSSGC